MIKKLKRKFILLATVSMLILMTVLICAMNLINYSMVINEADSVISVLSHPGIAIHDKEKPTSTGSAPKPNRKNNDPLPPGMSPEVPYESRYFTVRCSSDGKIIEKNVDRIISVDDTTVENYAYKALSKHSDSGFIGNFRFAVFENGRDTQIIVLDCGRRLDAFYHFMLTSITIGFSGCLILFIIFLLAANRIIRPITESYEKQKRFITDAGHEIKTPLTVISANVDLLESDIGGNECLSDIREQTNRLTALTEDLVTLSRMEESKATMLMTDFPLSDLVTEIAMTFRVPMLSREKQFTFGITPDLTMNGSPDKIRQLVSILLDNAMKYSPPESKVSLSLTASAKEILLTVSNTASDPIQKEDIPKLFDRFYRTDASRNSETGGHGIGLSIASAIVDAHKGKINASVNNDNVFTVSAVFPV